jgi:hypothetical protein
MGGTHGWIVEGGVAITVYEIGWQVEMGRQRRSAAAAAGKAVHGRAATGRWEAKLGGI